MAVAGSGGWIPSIEVFMKDGKLLTAGNAQNAPRSLVYSHHWQPHDKPEDFYTTWRRQRTGDKTEPRELFAGSLYAGYLMLLIGERVRIDFRFPHMIHLNRIHDKNRIDPTVLKGMRKAGVSAKDIVNTWRATHADAY